MTVEIGLRFVKLGVVTIGTAIKSPVNGTQGISRDVLSVVGELRAEPSQLTAVAANTQSLDDFPSNELEIAQLHEILRVEVFGFRQILGHLFA